MSGESRTVTVEVKVTIPAACGTEEAPPSPQTLPGEETDSGTGTVAARESGRKFGNSEIGMGETGYRQHMLWKDLNGTHTLVGFTFFTNNAYIKTPTYDVNQDNWVWETANQFPDVFHLHPCSVTDDEPPIPDTGHTRLTKANVKFGGGPEALPSFAGTSKFWQVYRRNSPGSTTWFPRKAFLQRDAAGAITWWAKNDGSISEINGKDYLDLAGDESLRFVLVTANPADNTGYRKAATG